MNQSPLNTTQLNTLGVVESDSSLITYDMLEFDGYSLQSDNVISQMIKAGSTPSRELVTFRTPRDHGGQFSGDYFRERRIVVSGYIKQSTSTLLEDALDTFKRRLTLSEGNLDWKVNGVVRRIKATLANPQEIFGRREGYHITYCPFDLEFLALEPFWHDVDYTASTYLSVTNLVYNNLLENLGTFKAKAVLIVLVEAASSVTGFQFENTTNGEKISISETISVGDILVFDGEEKSVTQNGVEIDYDGVFPNLEYGTNTYTLTTTGASIQFTLTIKLRKTYL